MREIKIDGVELPGTLLMLRVNGDIIIDEIDIQDKDGHVKQPAGYNEGQIIIELILTSDKGDVYSQLASLQSLYKKIDAQVKPDVHIILNRHINRRGIKKVLFRNFESWEQEEDDSLRIHIELEEYIPLESQVVNEVVRNEQKEKIQSVLPELDQSAQEEIFQDGEKL